MRHLNRLLLLAVARGELPAELVISIAMEHVGALCPECRREIQLAQLALAKSKPSAGPQVVTAVLEKHVEDQRTAQLRAHRDLASLLKLTPEERSSRIDRARTRFKGPHFTQLLLDKSQETIASHPDEALHFAKLALVTVLHFFVPRNHELHAQVLAQLGNASRAAGEFEEANVYFASVRQVIVNHALSDNSALLARIDDLESSLRMDQRRLDRAEELLARALFLYSMAEAPVPDRVRVLVKLGVLYQLQGKLVEAVDVTEAALQAVVNAPGELKLAFAALYNLATFHVDLGNSQAAMKVLAANRELVEEVTEPLHLIRLVGLRGKIAAIQGDLATAEEALLKTRDGFLSHGDAFAFDAAIVSLDLAMIYAKQNRAADLHATVAAMIPVLQTNALHREALAAALLLLDAIQRGTVSLAFLQEVNTYMRDAQRNPFVKFEPATGGIK